MPVNHTLLPLRLVAVLLLTSPLGCGEESPPAEESGEDKCLRFPNLPECQGTGGEGEGEVGDGDGETPGDTPDGDGDGDGAGAGDDGGEGEADGGDAGADETGDDGGEAPPDACADGAEVTVAGSFIETVDAQATFQNVAVSGRHAIGTGCLGWLEVQASSGACLLTVIWPGGDPPQAGESYGPKDVQVTYEAGDGCPGGDGDAGVIWFGGDSLIVTATRWGVPQNVATDAESCIAGIDLELELTGALSGPLGATLGLAESKLIVAGDALSDATQLDLACAADVCAVDGDCAAGQWCDNSAEDSSAVCLEGCRAGDDAECPAGEYCAEDHSCQIGCDVDDDCPGGESCDLLANRCVGQGCQADADCGGRVDWPDSRYCNVDVDPARCEQGCRDAQDCPGAQPCLEDSRVCGCRQDEQCGQGEVCSALECVPACGGDEDCGEGEYCDGEGHCIAGCRVDDYEPNETRAACADLEALQGGWDLALCGEDNDADWLCVPLQAGETVTATITFGAADPDLDLELWTADDQRVAQENAPGGGTETLTFGPVQPGGAGVYRLGVIPDDFLNTDYRLDIDVAAGDACVPDELEDDANDARGTAEAIDGGGRWDDLTICNGGEDWYSVRLREGDGLSVALDFEGDDGWLLAQIWHPNEAFAQALEESVNDRGDDSATVVHQGDEVQAAGDYLIRVYSPDPLDPIHYAMDVRVLQGQIECLADEHEAGGGNEDREDAAVIGPGVHRDLSLCADDGDWYEVNVPAGDEIVVETERLPDGRDFNHQLELFDSNGQPLDFSAQAGPSNRVSSDEASGRTFIQVRHPQGRQDEEIAYTMTVRVIDTPDGCVADDELENNDTRQTAAQLGELQPAPAVNTWEGLISCPDDQDWYELDLRDVQIDNLEITLTFAHADGDLDMFLKDDAGQTPCARNADCAAESSTDNESIVTGALPPGLYYLQIEGFDDAANTYDLNVTVTPYICGDDALAGNQSRDDAFPANLNNGTYDRDDLVICKGDSDWFSVEVAAGADLRVFAEFFHIQGDDLTVKVYDANGDWVQNIISINPPRVEGLSGNNNECVKVEAGGAGTYHVEVYGTGRESDYDIEIRSGNAVPDCPG